MYRTAETDGFFGGTDIVIWGPYGFKFVEYQSVGYTRVTMKDGKPHSERIQNPASQYERANESNIVKTQIYRDRMMVRDRKSREVLGEYVSFAIYPGWIDSKFLSATGFTFSPPKCFSPRAQPSRGGHFDHYAFIKSVLKPLSNDTGVK